MFKLFKATASLLLRNLFPDSSALTSDCHSTLFLRNRDRRLTYSAFKIFEPFPSVREYLISLVLAKKLWERESSCNQNNAT